MRRLLHWEGLAGPVYRWGCRCRWGAGGDRGARRPPKKAHPEEKPIRREARPPGA